MKQNQNIESLKKIFQQNQSINKQNKKIDNLTNENASIKGKINFIQKIVYSSLSRKVIKHCINKILRKNKDSMNFLWNEKNELFKIIFTKDINNQAQ